MTNEEAKRWNLPPEIEICKGCKHFRMMHESEYKICDCYDYELKTCRRSEPFDDEGGTEQWNG